MAESDSNPTEAKISCRDDIERRERVNALMKSDGIKGGAGMAMRFTFVRPAISRCAPSASAL